MIKMLQILIIITLINKYTPILSDFVNAISINTITDLIVFNVSACIIIPVQSPPFLQVLSIVK